VRLRCETFGDYGTAGGRIFAAASSACTLAVRRPSAASDTAPLRGAATRALAPLSWRFARIRIFRFAGHHHLAGILQIRQTSRLPPDFGAAAIVRPMIAAMPPLGHVATLPA